jgi:hypothetical protein
MRHQQRTQRWRRGQGGTASRVDAAIGIRAMSQQQLDQLAIARARYGKTERRAPFRAIFRPCRIGSTLKE